MRWLALVLTLLAAPADAACRQALALGLDVSSSVDDTEYRLQLDGLAAALLKPEVRAAFLALPDAPVRLYVFEWAGSGPKREVLNWQEIGSAADLAGVAARLRGTGRGAMPPSTAVGEAMLTGLDALAGQTACGRRVLDLSGDGRSNTGPRPRDVRPMLGDITVNGLVVGSDPRSAGDARSALVGELQGYYAAEVIYGPQAFVEVAMGFADFEAAMARKLLKELQFFAVSELGAVDAGR